MKFQSENHLQAFIHSVVGGQREFFIPELRYRIDIRTDDYDIEVKPYLNGPSMDKAAGQLMRYSSYSGDRQQVIAGCAPDSFNDSIRKQADAFRRAGIEVWFIDREPVFQEAYRKLSGARRSPNPFNYSRAPTSDAGYSEEQEKSENAGFFWILGGAIALGILFLFSNGDNTAPAARPELPADKLPPPRTELYPLREPPVWVDLGQSTAILTAPAGSKTRLWGPNNEAVDLPSGTRVRVIQEANAEGFLLVEHQGKRLWVKRQYLENKGEI